MTVRYCPCGHLLDANGDIGDYVCLNGLIYGPCGHDNCYGACSDDWGTCKSLDGCCDPRKGDA